jgi:hypothetical protein
MCKREGYYAYYSIVAGQLCLLIGVRALPLWSPPIISFPFCRGKIDEYNKVLSKYT